MALPPVVEVKHHVTPQPFLRPVLPRLCLNEALHNHNPSRREIEDKTTYSCLPCSIHIRIRIRISCSYSHHEWSQRAGPLAAVPSVDANDPLVVQPADPEGQQLNNNNINNSKNSNNSNTKQHGVIFVSTLVGTTGFVYSLSLCQRETSRNITITILKDNARSIHPRAPRTTSRKRHQARHGCDGSLVRHRVSQSEKSEKIEQQCGYEPSAAERSQDISTTAGGCLQRAYRSLGR